MQTTMNLEPCCCCGQPIPPDEPTMQVASADLDVNGRAFSTPVRVYHLRGRCYEDHRRRERAERDALRASLKTA